jgi:protein-S-isoprenylcysteine O-methyltransferase Ste14
MPDQSDTAGVVAPPPLLALGAIVLGLLLDRVAPAYILSILISPFARVGIGLILMSAGTALGISAMRAFTRAGTYVEPWRPTVSLVTGDVFQWLRNPMYVGLIMMLAGFSVMIASDWTLVMTVVFALVIHFGVIKREERYLDAKFGDVYRSYRKKVRRYGWPPFDLR